MNCEGVTRTPRAHLVVALPFCAVLVRAEVRTASGGVSHRLTLCVLLSTVGREGERASQTGSTSTLPQGWNLGKDTARAGTRPSRVMCIRLARREATQVGMPCCVPLIDSARTQSFSISSPLQKDPPPPRPLAPSHMESPHSTAIRPAETQQEAGRRSRDFPSGSRLGAQEDA